MCKKNYTYELEEKIKRGVNYFKRPAEKSANVDITEEPLTSAPRVEIEDGEDENTNDNIVPIFSEK